MDGLLQQADTLSLSINQTHTQNVILGIILGGIQYIKCRWYHIGTSVIDSFRLGLRGQSGTALTFVFLSLLVVVQNEQQQNTKHEKSFKYWLCTRWVHRVLSKISIQFLVVSILRIERLFRKVLLFVHEFKDVLHTESWIHGKCLLYFKFCGSRNPSWNVSSLAFIVQSIRERRRRVYRFLRALGWNISSSTSCTANTILLWRLGYSSISYLDFIEFPVVILFVVFESMETFLRFWDLDDERIVSRTVRVHVLDGYNESSRLSYFRMAHRMGPLVYVLHVCTMQVIRNHWWCLCIVQWSRYLAAMVR